jgi:hypothetical protein
MLSATELLELVKLNVLMQHYEETKKHDGPVSFADFLVMHYITDDGNKNDDARDEQLPFKSLSYIAQNSTSIVLYRAPELVEAPVTLSKTDFSLYNDPCFHNNFTGSVWNPPRT